MLWLRKNVVINRWFWFPASIVLVAGLVFAIIAFGTHKQIVDAQVVNFYSDTCDGEWKNPQNATGEPDADNESNPYTLDNAAYLEGVLSPLTCYGFSGTLPPQTYHTRVQVRFSWQQIKVAETPVSEPAVSDDMSGVVSDVDTELVVDDATSTPAVDDLESNPSVGVDATTTATTTTATTTIITESLDNLETEQGTSSSEQGVNEVVTPPVTAETVDPLVEPATSEVIEPEPEPVPEPEPEPEPKLETEPLSWLRQLFGPVVYAQETVISSTTDSDNTETEEAASPAGEIFSEAPVSDILPEPAVVIDIESEALEATSSEAVADKAQFMVEYTLDSVTWVPLGEVVTIENDVRLEFPIEVLPTLADISSVQLRIVPVLAVDALPMYVDAIWLEVSYAPLGELGVHSISSIVPSVAPITSMISEDVADASSTAPHITPQDFVNRIRSIHGIDEQYALVTLMVTATSSEVWLFDMSEEMIHHIGSGTAEIGTIPAGMKDGMIFWLNATEDTIFTYDLRTAGRLHEMLLVQNLPPDSSYRLTFPFTDWELVWQGDRFYFYSKKTGEVFRDENTRSAQLLFEYFPLLATVPLERIQEIGLTFITESDIIPNASLQNPTE